MRTDKQRKEHREYMREWLISYPRGIKYKKSQKKYQKEHYKKYYNEHYKELKDKYGLGAGTIMRYGFKTALFIYEKFDRKCVKCDSVDDLTIHHLDHKGRNYIEQKLKPNNSLDNLILICRKCHGSIHGKEGGGRPHKK